MHTEDQIKKLANRKQSLKLDEIFIDKKGRALPYLHSKSHFCPAAPRAPRIVLRLPLFAGRKG